MKEQLQQNPRSRDALHQMAAMLFKQGEYEAALTYINRLAKLQSLSVEVVALRGRILTGGGFFQEAEELYLEQLKAHPYEEKLLAGLAELMLLTGREEESRQQYLKLLHNQPENRRALLALIFIEQARGNLEQSLNYLEPLLSAHYNDRLVHVLAAQFYFDIQEWASAETQLAQLKLWPEMDGWREDWLRARIAMARGRLDEAEQLLTGLLKKNADLPLLWYTKAEVARQRNDVEQAVVAMSTAARLAPEVQLYRLASERLALQYLHASHPLRQQLAQFRYQQGQLLEKQGYLFQAKRSKRRAAQLQPTHLTYWLASAHADFEQGFYLSYLKKLQHRQQLFPQDPLDEEVALAASAVNAKIFSTTKLAEESLFRYPLQVVALPSKHKNTHSSLSEYLAYNVQDQLAPFEKFRFMGQPVVLPEGQQSFLAPGNREFFILKIEVLEAGSSLQLNGRIYLSRSGETLGRLRFAVSNLQLGELGRKVSQWVDQLFPTLAVVIEQKFDRVIIQSNGQKGLDTPKVWTIIGPGRTVLSAKFPYVFTTKSTPGQVEIQVADEKLASGKLVVDGYLGGDVRGSLLVPLDDSPPTIGDGEAGIADPALVFLRGNVLSW